MQHFMNLKWKAQPIHLLETCKLMRRMPVIHVMLSTLPFSVYILVVLLFGALDVSNCLFELYVQTICFRTLNGKRVLNPEDFEALPEFATICVMCNDSSVDYNAVRTVIILLFILNNFF